MAQIINQEMKDPTGQKLYVSGATQEDVNSAITSASLTPSAPITPIQPDATPIAPVAGLNAEITPLAPLPQETQQSNLIKEIQGLTLETTGEAGFRAQQEQAQGIPELQKAQSDLSARLKTLQNEALAIPLQLQQESAGRGITAGGLQPIQTAALRNNAIQALSVSSLLEASRGNLTTAQSLADRAVAQKYDPIKAEINAKLANLELLSKDPTLTLAQKNRLNAQKAIQDAKAAEVAKQEADSKEINSTLNLAIKYGLTDTALMERIQSAKSPIEAKQLAARYLQDPMAKIELREATYKAEKARLELAAFGKENEPLPITGNTVTDVATAISSNKVGATTKTTLSAIMGVQGALEQIAKDNPTGSIKGISPLNTLLDFEIPFTDAKLLNLPLGARNALMSKEALTSRAYIQGINLKVQQWASGAALTEQQTKQVREMTPKTNDTDRVVKDKVNALYEFMNQQVRSALLSEGIDMPIPQDVDLWTTKETLEDIFSS